MHGSGYLGEEFLERNIHILFPAIGRQTKSSAAAVPKWRPVTGTGRSRFHIPNENVLLTDSITSYRLLLPFEEQSVDTQEFKMECLDRFWN